MIYLALVLVRARAGDEPRFVSVVNGDECFPPLGFVRSSVLFILALAVVAFAGASFYAMLKVYLQPTQAQISDAFSSSPGDRDPASFLSRREWEIDDQ
jgi:hypothetical protein